MAERQALADLVKQLLLMFYLQHLHYQLELELFESAQATEEVALQVVVEAGPHLQ